MAGDWGDAALGGRGFWVLFSEGALLHDLGRGLRGRVQAQPGILRR